MKEVGIDGLSGFVGGIFAVFTCVSYVLYDYEELCETSRKATSTAGLQQNVFRSRGTTLPLVSTRTIYIYKPVPYTSIYKVYHERMHAHAQRGTKVIGHCCRFRALL